MFFVTWPTQMVRLIIVLGMAVPIQATLEKIVQCSELIICTVALWDNLEIVMCGNLLLLLVTIVHTCMVQAQYVYCRMKHFIYVNINLKVVV